MTDEIAKLIAEVSKTEGAEASALVLVQGISDYIKENFTCAVGILTYANRLEAFQSVIAEAVVAKPIPPAASESV